MATKKQNIILNYLKKIYYFNKTESHKFVLKQKESHEVWSKLAVQIPAN